MDIILIVILFCFSVCVASKSRLCGWVSWSTYCPGAGEWEGKAQVEPSAQLLDIFSSNGPTYHTYVQRPQLKYPWPEELPLMDLAAPGHKSLSRPGHPQTPQVGPEHVIDSAIRDCRHVQTNPRPTSRPRLSFLFRVLTPDNQLTDSGVHAV